MVSWMNVVEKRIVRLEDICYKEFNNFGKYVYFALSYDMKFRYWRVDIYLQYNQQKYVCLLNE